MTENPQSEASSSTPTHQYSRAPTAAVAVYDTPSGYLGDAYDSNTPHAYDPLIPPSVSGIQTSPLEDAYAFEYPNSFHPDGVHSTFLAPVTEHTSPSGRNQLGDDATPVIPSDQAPIHPSNLPIPPNYLDGSISTIRAPPQSRPSLMSPFKADPQAQVVDSAVYPVPIEHRQYMENAAFYNTAHPHPYNVQQMSPLDHMAYPQVPSMQLSPYMPADGFYAAAAAAGQQAYHQMSDYSQGDGASPTSVKAALAVSRSGSISSGVRPKVKLTFADKREICLLHERDSSLRQEDIAKMYGVDRSTISKIILNKHRWLQPQEPQLPPLPKLPKSIGGRFPAVEAKLDEWMDLQIAAGHDVRDSTAREQAKTFAREIGFPTDRFKASAKWLDKFKERRRAAGKAVMASPVQGDYSSFYPMQAPPPHYVDMGHMDGSIMLSRSQSTATISSSDSSSQEPFQPTPQYLPMGGNTHVRMASTRSESDLLHTDTTPNSRSRSQSSPQVFIDSAMQSPSSGKAPKQRPTPLMLQRQNSYHGTSPSPHRPSGLQRTNSTQGTTTVRRHHRPLSLAASAFGFTNMTPSGTRSPIQSPSMSSSHNRQRSESALAPCTNGFSNMTISPNMSEFGETSLLPMPMTVPPLTPNTPGGQQGQAGVFPNTDYGDLQPPPTHLPPHHQQYHQHHQYAATMPDKYYGGGGVVGQYYSQMGAYAVTDFGQTYMVPTSGAQQWQ